MHMRKELKKFAHGIYFLGREGVVQIKGLQVAFLSGKDSKPHKEDDMPIKDYIELYTDNYYALNDIESIIEKANKKHIDLLLTCGWPNHLHKYTEYYFPIN